MRAAYRRTNYLDERRELITMRSSFSKQRGNAPRPKTQPSLGRGTGEGAKVAVGFATAAGTGDRSGIDSSQHSR